MAGETQSRISVKEAIDAAFEFVAATVGAREKLRDLRLEELEFAEDRDAWQITLSFLRKTTPEELDLGQNESIARALSGKGPKYRRDFKSLIVDGGTGAVRSMQIRSPV